MTARKNYNAFDMVSQRINNELDPASAQDPATRNYVDTTTAAISYGGWGDGDQDIFGDILSTMPRALMAFMPVATGNHISIGSVTTNTQQILVFKVKRAFTSTGVRYVTGQTAQSGQTTTVTLFTGTSLGSMVPNTAVSAAFSATSSFVQVAWSSQISVPVGYAVIVFTSNTNVSTAAQLMTNNQGPAAGTGLLAPNASTFLIGQKSGTSLANPTDFTTGVTAETLLPWVAIY